MTKSSFERLLEALRASPLIDHVLAEDALPSTNDLALQRDLPMHPELVITRLQTHGRGRRENTWQAEAGALTFSLILPSLPLPRERIPQVSLVAALAVADTIRSLTTPQLKWPNDVYVQDRKLSGILVEPHPQGGLVIGVGLNLTNDVSQLEVPAINLQEAAGIPPEPAPLLLGFLLYFFDLLDLLQHDHLALADAWRPLCWLTGKTVTFDSGTRGEVLGLAPSGGLRLASPEGQQVLHGGVIVSIH